MKMHERLRAFREARFDSIADFHRACVAAGIPVSASQLSMLENGRRKVEPWIARLAPVLERQPGEFYEQGLKDEGEAYKPPRSFEEQVWERQAFHYLEEDWYRDIWRMVEELYRSEGLPLSPIDQGTVTHSIANAYPFDGETHAEDSEELRRHMAWRRKQLHARFFPEHDPTAHKA